MKKSTGLHAALISILLSLMVFLSCSGPGPVPEGRAPFAWDDGTLLEERVVRGFGRRPVEIFHVYRDSSDNYIKHGPAAEFFLNGQKKFEGNYFHGKLHGMAATWHENAQKEGELTYENGVLNGPAITWHENGMKKSEKTWVNGKLHGAEKKWDNKGRLLQEVRWENNRLLASEPE